MLPNEINDGGNELQEFEKKIMRMLNQDKEIAYIFFVASKLRAELVLLEIDLHCFRIRVSLTGVYKKSVKQASRTFFEFQET